MLKVTVPISSATSSSNNDTVIINCTLRGLIYKAKILTCLSFCHDHVHRVLHAALFQPVWDYSLVYVLTTATANSTDNDDTTNVDATRTHNHLP